MQRKCQETQARPAATSAEKGIHSSTPCPLKIVEVNALGHFIRIFNSSPHQRVDLSGYILWQLEGNYPVTMYRFPQNIILPALQHITVWASATKISHNPPTDLVWKGRIYFRSDKHCVTVLSRPSGQPVSSYTTYDLYPPHTPKSQRANILRESIQRHSREDGYFGSAFSEAEIPRRSQSASARSSARQNLPMTPTHLRATPISVTGYPSRLNQNSPLVRLVAQTSVRSKHGFKFLSHVPFTCDLLYL